MSPLMLTLQNKNTNNYLRVSCIYLLIVELESINDIILMNLIDMWEMSIIAVFFIAQ